MNNKMHTKACNKVFSRKLLTPGALACATKHEKCSINIGIKYNTIVFLKSQQKKFLSSLSKQTNLHYWHARVQYKPHSRLFESFRHKYYYDFSTNNQEGNVEPDEKVSALWLIKNRKSFKLDRLFQGVWNYGGVCSDENAVLLSSANYFKFSAEYHHIFQLQPVPLRKLERKREKRLLNSLIINACMCVPAFTVLLLTLLERTVSYAWWKETLILGAIVECVPFYRSVNIPPSPFLSVLWTFVYHEERVRGMLQSSMHAPNSLLSCIKLLTASFLVAWSIFTFLPIIAFLLLLLLSRGKSDRKPGRWQCFPSIYAHGHDILSLLSGSNLSESFLKIRYKTKTACKQQRFIESTFLIISFKIRIIFL